MPSYDANEGQGIVTDAQLIERMAAAAGDKKMRFLLAPSVWQPELVYRDSGITFSPTAAWQYISDVLRMHKFDLCRVTLRLPPGAEAFVMVSNFEVQRPVYIKFMFPGAGKIFGRSFHIAEHKSLL